MVAVSSMSAISCAVAGVKEHPWLAGVPWQDAGAGAGAGGGRTRSPSQ